MDTVGERIKYLRNCKRLSQDEFGKRMGFSKQIVSNYENNLSKPSYEFLNKLVSEFNTNLNWLIANQGAVYINAPEELSPEMEKAFDAFLKKKGLI